MALIHTSYMRGHLVRKLLGLGLVLIASLLCADDFNYTFAGFYNLDHSGNYFSQVGLISYDKTGNDFNAVLSLFFSQNFSMSDTINLELRQANVSYVNDWLRLTVGREDISSLLSPTYYFGRYNLMGARRVQGFVATSNFLLKTGVSEEKLVEIPPTAISFGFIPNFFNNFVTSQYDNPMWFGQFRTRFKFNNTIGKELTVSLAANYSQTRDILFSYSSLSGQPSVSFTADISIDHNYSFYGEYSMQNVYLPATSVACIGGNVLLSNITLGIFDSLIVESQLPLNPSLQNAFTGGDFYTPVKATLPQTTYFAKLFKRLGGLEISLSMTNGVGDYTFARPSFSSLNNCMPVPLFKGNEDPTAMTEFYSRDYGTIAYRLNIAYKF